MSIILQIHFFNKLRRSLGWQDALRTYYNLRISKTDRLSLNFLVHPFRLRIGNRADMETFNEVLLRKAYNINISFTPKTIIDAGANIGLTSIYYASKYPETHIISIEPAAHNFQLLKENTRNYKNITCIQAALWNEETMLQLTDPGRGDNSLQVTAGDCNADTPAVTINNLIKQHRISQIDILKIDIEGAELQVFSNNYELWLPITRVLIIEVHDKNTPGAARAVLNTIAKYNFTQHKQGANFLFINNDIA